MLTSDFTFELPNHLIAQEPAPLRDASRLLVLQRQSGNILHRQFADLKNFLREGDVLVANNSRVLPARLRGANRTTGGQFEILLIEESASNEWWAMLKPGKRARLGTEIILKNHAGDSVDLCATVLATNEEGHRLLRFQGGDIYGALEELGEIPLPPYISRAPNENRPADKTRYQTVYAAPSGSIAAPTAGLHFTPSLLEELRHMGVRVQFVTLHVGIGTFAPVKAETISEHRMHEERYRVGEETAAEITAAKREGRRIIAVGTTSLRVLESVAAKNNGAMVAGEGRTRIFIHPPYEFKIVDALLTNFHLPKSTLLMLASAFASPGKSSGREFILKAYNEAVKNNYRFFSYGDAMLIL